MSRRQGMKEESRAEKVLEEDWKEERRLTRENK